MGLTKAQRHNRMMDKIFETARYHEVKERRICPNCKINAMFTNARVEQGIGYGSIWYSRELACSNCGHEVV